MFVPHYVEKYHFFCDLAHTPIKPQIDIIKGMIGLFRDNFNGFAGHAYIYKPTKAFKLLWKIGSKFMPKKTLEKVKFVEDGKEKNFTDDFDLDDLQQQYGGNVPDITENFWPPQNNRKDLVPMNKKYMEENNIKEFHVPVFWLQNKVSEKNIEVPVKKKARVKKVIPKKKVEETKTIKIEEIRKKSIAEMNGDEVDEVVKNFCEIY